MKFIMPISHPTRMVLLSLIFVTVLTTIGILIVCITLSKEKDELCIRTFKFVQTKIPIYDSRPKSVIVVDVNNDTQYDFIVTNSGTNTIGVFLGFSNGTFQDQKIYTIDMACQPYAIAAGDFNRDDCIDIVVACYGTNSFAVLFGQNNATFIYSRAYSLGSSRPMSLVVADFNNDEILDIAVANYVTHNVGIHFGSEDGNFDERIIYSTGYDSLPCSLAVSDLNDDMHLDIVIANSGTHNIGVLIGQTEGQFKEQIVFSTGHLSESSSVVIADFNNDTRLDVIVANRGTDTIGVLLGIGNCSFERVMLFRTNMASRPISIIVGYFYTTNNLDVAVVTAKVSAVIIFKGFGDGTFMSNEIHPINAESGSLSIAAGDFNDDGRSDIVVTNSVDNNIVVLLRSAMKQFSPPIVYPTMGDVSVTSIAVGDFNNDLELDIIYASRASNIIGLFLGTHNGSFTFKTHYYLGNPSTPYMLEVGDLNNDSKLDVVFPNFEANNVWIMFGNGVGEFKSSLKLPTGADSNPICVALADLNKDNKLDIFVANMQADNIGIRLGYGNQSFSSQITYSTGKGSSPSTFSVRDLNGDGQLDLAVIASGWSQILILLGSAKGNFKIDFRFFISDVFSLVSMVIEDFNHDNQPDIALVNQFSSSLGIFLGSGNGTFDLFWESDMELGSKPFAFTTAYIDDDNILDLVVAKWGTNSIGTFFGDGDGSFTRQISYSVGDGTRPVTVALGNFNNDQFIDMAVATTDGGSVIVMFGGAMLDSFKQVTYSTGSGSHMSSFVVEDFNKDNLADIAIANTAQSSVELRLGLDGGKFSKSMIYSSGVDSHPSYLIVNDLDNDNNTDIIVTDPRNDNIFLLVGYNNGTFLRHEILSTGNGSHPNSIATADFNNDNLLDLVVANEQTNELGIFLGFTYPTFKIKNITTLGAYSRPSDIIVGDFNGDGKYDIAVTCSLANEIAVLMGTVDGEFSDLIHYSTGESASPSSLAANDFNNDTILDIVVANLVAMNIVIFIGVGNGTFMKNNVYSTGNNSSPSDIDVIDVDEDFHIDIVVTNVDSGNIGIFFGYGNGSFRNQITYSTGLESRPSSILIYDVNKDNHLDIVATLFGTNEIVIFLRHNNGISNKPNFFYISSGSQPYSVNIADFNMNNLMDFVVANYGTGDITILYDYDNETFASRKSYTTGTKSLPLFVTVGDLNDDNRTDIAVALSGSNTVALFFGYGNGEFTQQMNWPPANETGAKVIVLNDFNGDSRVDIAVINFYSDTVTVLLRDNVQLYHNQVKYSTGANSHPCSLAIVDLNQDNHDDIVVVNQGNDNFGIFFGLGNVNFTNQTVFSTGNGSMPKSISFGDFNNDSLVDLVVANAATSCISIFLGDGYGNFSTIITYSTDVNALPSSVTVSDLNADNIWDIVVANSRSNNIYIFYGKGNGTFSRSESYPLNYASHPNFARVADLNQDHWMDIAVVEQNSNDINILYQMCDK